MTMLSITPQTRPWGRVADALQRVLRPAVGFSHPIDVLKDPALDAAEKRAILSSWASDASAVEGEPTLRWLFGTEGPVPLAEVLEALARLDHQTDRPFKATPSPRPEKGGARAAPRLSLGAQRRRGHGRRLAEGLGEVADVAGLAP